MSYDYDVNIDNSLVWEMGYDVNTVNSEIWKFGYSKDIKTC